MSKLIATLVASLFAAAAFAQTGGVPPTQPAAGVNTKQEAAAGSPMASKSQMATDSSMAKPMSSKAEARKARSSKRKEKRVEKVGDKPLN